MRHLVLPTLSGACSTDADTIETIEWLTDETCRIHLKPTPSPLVKPGMHNCTDVRLPAKELRSAITDMDDGDVYDPWNLGMVGAE